MGNYFIDVAERKNFTGRFLSEFAFGFIIFCILDAILYVVKGYDIDVELITACVLLTWLALRCLRDQYNYITHIDIQDGSFHIVYMNMWKTKEVRTSLSNVDIKKRAVFSRDPKIYLRIRINSKITIRQYEIGDWNKEMLKAMFYKITGKEETISWLGKIFGKLVEIRKKISASLP